MARPDREFPEDADAVAQRRIERQIRETLGDSLTDEFITYKQAEWEEYHQTVSDWEVQRYARFLPSFPEARSPSSTSGPARSRPSAIDFPAGRS